MTLTPALKQQIGQWYKALQQQIPDFVSRAPQRQMIAEVAKALAGDYPRHLAIEAPTGVGKTLSYLIPGIAIGRAELKTLVVSTANVALQDQIFNKDLPLLRQFIPDLTFTAAFGRRRYVCPRNLAALACDAPEQGALLLFMEEMQTSSADDRRTCERLQQTLHSGSWDGLRDHSQESVSDRLWQQLSTDKANCLARNCPYYRECPFFLARREIEDADVVVTNHALVMAAMESDSVLPAAKNMLLVLDEGHHVPDVARDALEMSGEVSVNAVQYQLDNLIQQVGFCLAQFPPKSPPRLMQPDRLGEQCGEVRAQLQAFERLSSLFLPASQPDADYRFPMGVLPDEMRECCQQLAKLSDSLRGLAEYLLNDLAEKTGKHDMAKLHQAMLRISRLNGYWEAQSHLWRLAALEKSSNAPVSKWLVRERRDNQLHLYLHCAGIRVCDQLDRLLWRNLSHVVLTSATLRSLNSFARLKELSGLDEDEGDTFIALDSPFNHQQQGKLVIPQMRYEPLLADEAQHIAEMARFFRAELQREVHKGLLVLFASQRAMQQFLSEVPDLRLMLLVQGDKPRYRLVELHRQRVEQGQTSVLVGLQSFAEGLDLKGELLSQVHIHKIAFPPVDSPVILTEGEWLKSHKRHPFVVQSLPSASFNLIQQVGRLIRSHDCFGEIVIYDRRLLTKGYGAQLLAALPVFPIEQRAMPGDGEASFP
ncbi:ATP-dependent DNA helicase DinG [Dickeya lacustris]|uniref:ATP-dependent DNA helicase DinG n=1 Tax=Dickeya lacustris TaxID=2259638 RepID=A0ABY8G747_9GAMM|nr:ATP-dependent DNA helicase DinG [Dickeya lacustris]WFN55788.1 ATP-dependent DNA helicase DinG [Dickeya lacustris]